MLAACKTLASVTFLLRSGRNLAACACRAGFDGYGLRGDRCCEKAATGQPYHGRSRGLGRCLLCNWAAEHGGAALDARWVRRACCGLTP